MRIIVADQEPSTRSALRMLLAAQADMDLVGEAADLVELLSEIKANDPDLVILDWDVLGQRIDRLLDLLELFHRPPTIIALGVHAEDRKVALDIGVAGFAYKGEPPQRLLAVIRQVQKSHQSIQTGNS